MMTQTKAYAGAAIFMGALAACSEDLLVVELQDDTLVVERKQTGLKQISVRKMDGKLAGNMIYVPMITHPPTAPFGISVASQSGSSLQVSDFALALAAAQRYCLERRGGIGQTQDGLHAAELIDGEWQFLFVCAETEDSQFSARPWKDNL